MSPGVLELVNKLVGAISKLAPAIFAFFLGKKSVEKDLLKDDLEAREEELEAEYEADRIRNNPTLLERMRNRYKRPE